MKKIEIKILNPEAVKNSVQMMVCAARLTQSGHKISSMDDFMELYNKEYSEKTVSGMVHLPHPTIQKFGVINAVIVGASRRCLAQLTRHENETKFMSASLQYSNYAGGSDFVIPYSVIQSGKHTESRYIATCQDAMNEYKFFNDNGIDNDACGYMAPQGLRNVLIMSCTPFQWKHIIGQRTCKRNTIETRYVLLKIWECLYNLDPVFYAPDVTGPFCQRETCKEGKMSCGNPIEKKMTPNEILRKDFPLLYENSDR